MKKMELVLLTPIPLPTVKNSDGPPLPLKLNVIVAKKDTIVKMMEPVLPTLPLMINVKCGPVIPFV